VAYELSRLPATDGKERSHGDGSLPLREIRLEGLGALIQLPSGAAGEAAGASRWAKTQEPQVQIRGTGR